MGKQEVLTPQLRCNVCLKCMEVVKEWGCSTWGSEWGSLEGVESYTWGRRDVTRDAVVSLEWSEFGIYVWVLGSEMYAIGMMQGSGA